MVILGNYKDNKTQVESDRLGNYLDSLYCFGMHCIVSLIVQFITKRQDYRTNVTCDGCYQFQMIPQIRSVTTVIEPSEKFLTQKGERKGTKGGRLFGPISIIPSLGYSQTPNLILFLFPEPFEKFLWVGGVLMLIQ